MITHHRRLELIFCAKRWVDLNDVIGREQMVKNIYAGPHGQVSFNFDPNLRVAEERKLLAPLIFRAFVSLIAILRPENKTPGGKYFIVQKSLSEIKGELRIYTWLFKGVVPYQEIRCQPCAFPLKRVCDPRTVSVVEVESERLPCNSQTAAIRK